MITKKEDLHFTYVKNEPELREVFIEKCDEFGIKVFDWEDSEPYLEVYGDDESEFEIVGTVHLEPQSKELTMSDLKPRTKTEFVKCEFECAWHAIKALEDGEEIYTKRSHKDFVLIDNAPDVLRFLYDLHRKVETEIDERQEFIEAAKALIDRSRPAEYSLGAMFDSGKFKLVDSND